MRILPALIALAVLAGSAGCFGGSESSKERTPTPVAETTPTPEATPAPASPEPTPTTPEPSAPATPTVAPPESAPATPRKELYNATFDFASQGDPTGQSPKSFETMPALAEHARIFVNITLTRSSTTPTMVPVSGTLNSPAVRILDPNGGESTTATAEGTTSVEVPALPGAWTVRYEGAGTLRATVSLVAVA